MSTSVLDDLGEQVTGILAPVSLCMALTVALVKAINPSGDSDRNSVYIAAAYYDEQEEDSAGEKLSGSIVNALIFIGIITAMTFVLFLLFKYGCTRVINVYMGFVLLDIFFFLAGTVAIKLLRKTDLHVDAISLCFILYNFAVVGSLGLFFWTIPIVVKQGYLVIIGVIVAYIFTWIPEWTTWVMLVLMSIYDICAVLIPGGPLKALVELAIERGENIPALVYEVRPTRDNGGGWDERYRRPGRRNESRDYVSQFPSASITAAVTMASVGDEEEVRPDPADRAEGDADRLLTGETSEQAGNGSESREETAIARVERADSESSMGLGLPDSLKLGLGDFIFYSLLVGRAAFYDFMTVFAAYIGIVAGMGSTLLLLALYQKALPALPLSILFGLIFYFTTKILLEPFIVPMWLALTFF